MVDRWRRCCTSSLSNTRRCARCFSVRGSQISSMRTRICIGAMDARGRAKTNSEKHSFDSGNDYDRKPIIDSQFDHDQDDCMILHPIYIILLNVNVAVYPHTLEYAIILSCRFLQLVYNKMGTSRHSIMSNVVNIPVSVSCPCFCWHHRVQTRTTPPHPHAAPQRPSPQPASSLSPEPSPNIPPPSSLAPSPQ